MKKPHKHAALIKAWADGAEIECLVQPSNVWELRECPVWSVDATYRIKPEPKPDVVKYMGFASDEGECPGYIDESHYVVNHWSHQLKLTFDGETGKLKSAEVV